MVYVNVTNQIGQAIEVQPVIVKLYVDVQCAKLGYLLRVEQTTTDVIVVMY